MLQHLACCACCAAGLVAAAAGPEGIAFAVPASDVVPADGFAAEAGETGVVGWNTPTGAVAGSSTYGGPGGKEA